MNLSYPEMQQLIDKGHRIYEIWKEPIYVVTKSGRRGGDFYTDPVLQAQAFSDTNRLPLNVSKRFPPLKKVKDLPRWQWSANDSVEMMLSVFYLAGYSVIRTEEKRNVFGGHYILYFVADIKRQNNET